MTKSLLAVGLGLALAAAACGGQPAAISPAPPHTTGQVYVRAGAEPSLWVVDWASRQVARTLPAGTPSPDWRALYRLSRGALDVLDPRDGRLRASHPAPDWAQAVHTSADGRWLVLSPTDPGDRFRVQDAAWAAAPVDVALPGGFTFDGISADGRRLYLLERLGPTHYQIRMYDLRRGALAPYVIADKTEIGKPMTGTAVAGFTTRSAAMQLTLYQRDDGGSAFVHTLPIGQEAQWAFCVDLPGPATGWGFAAAPDGVRFYAVNAAAGLVVELTAPPDQPPSPRQGQIAAQTGRPALAVSPDGRTLYVGSDAGVAAVDTRTLTVRASGLAGQRVTAMGAAPDGGVYAVTGATRLVRLDPRSLAVDDQVTLRGPLGAILHTT
jgi:hypothetical protein